MKTAFLHIFVLTLILSACIEDSKKGDDIVCETPYMRLGSICCLDMDSNGICDRDETTSTTFKPKTTTTTISTSATLPTTSMPKTTSTTTPTSSTSSTSSTSPSTSSTSSTSTTAPLFCVDSDGGEDIYVVGTVTKGSQQWVDRCHNQATLIEYLCIENVLTSKMVQCPTGCLDGKCLSCEDTDGGDNPYVFGSVSVGANLHKKDICSTIGDGKTLQEYYCLNETYIGMVKHICPSACVAGACI